MPSLKPLLLVLFALSALPAAAQDCEQSFPDIVGWWMAEDDAQDSAGPNHGTLRNGAAFTDGQIGRAFDFDGNGAHVDLGQAHNGGTTSLTIAAWIKKRADPLEATVFRKGMAGGGTPANAGYALVANSVATGFHAVDANQNLVVAQTGALPINRWFHVVGMLDREASEVRFFLDGELFQTTGFGGLGSTDSDQPLAIGAQAYLLIPPAQPFNGAIDDVQLYRRALTAAEVAQLYIAGRQGGCGAVVAQVSAQSLVYPHPDTWGSFPIAHDGTPLKLTADIQNTSPTPTTALVTFSRTDGTPIAGAIPPTSVTVQLPADGTAQAEIQLPSDGLSRNADGSTRMESIEFIASIEGVGKTVRIDVYPRPIFLFNGIWSGPETWQRVVTDANARPDAHRLTVKPVEGLLTSERALFPSIPYNDIETNSDAAHGFINRFRSEGNNFWKYYLVGHSMGGLMIRRYLHAYNRAFAADFAPPLGGTAVERIFTIGTPYLGSACADAAQYVRRDVYELTTDYQRLFNLTFPFSNLSSSLAAFSTPVPTTCIVEGEGDFLVSVASATRGGTIAARSLFTMIGLNPLHWNQTGAFGMFDLAIAPNTIGPPPLPARESDNATAPLTSTRAAVSSEWNTGAGSFVMPVKGGCAAPESVRVPTGNVSLSLLSDGVGTATITSPSGDTSVAPVTPFFSGAMFAPSQPGTWSLQLCSDSGAASFVDWSAMVAGSPYTHEVSDSIFSGGNKLIMVRVTVAPGAPLPLSASYVLSSPSQQQSGSLPLSELLQNGAAISVDSAQFTGEESLQLEIALILPDSVILRTITTISHAEIFASGYE